MGTAFKAADAAFKEAKAAVKTAEQELKGLNDQFNEQYDNKKFDLSSSIWDLGNFTFRWLGVLGGGGLLTAGSVLAVNDHISVWMFAVGGALLVLSCFTCRRGRGCGNT